MAINKIRYSTFRHVKSAFDQEKADKRRSLDFIDLVFSTFELHVFITFTRVYTSIKVNSLRKRVNVME